MKWLALSVMAVWSIAATVSMAQSEFYPLRDYQDDDSLEGAGWDSEPIAGFDQYPDMRNAWTRTLIYRLDDQTGLDPNGRPVPRFILKRRDGYRDNETQAVVETVTWADSRTCHRMFRVLERMTHLRAPSVDVGLRPWIPPDTETSRTFDDEGRMHVSPYSITMGNPMHGTTIRVWSDMGDNPGNFSSGSVSMASTGGLIADWSEFAEKWLRECWQEQQPSLV